MATLYLMILTAFSFMRREFNCNGVLHMSWNLDTPIKQKRLRCRKNCFVMNARVFQLSLLQKTKQRLTLT